MKKKLLAVLLCLFICSIAQAIDFSGSYVLKTPENTITLSLSQEKTGIISGSLSSTTGISFNIKAELDEDVAIGNCIQGENCVPFEAHFESDALSLTLMGETEQETRTIIFPLGKTQKASAAKMFELLSPSSVAKQANQASQPVASANSLQGSWVYQSQQGNLHLQFISTTQLTFNGDPASYQIQGDKIIVSADGETISYPFQLQNNQLQITFPDGTKVPFTRDSNTGTIGVNGQVFPQLLGRWKDIRSSGNTIIELFENGQFSYYSDYSASNSTAGQTNWGYSNSSGSKGTWKAVGSAEKGTIYYQTTDGNQDTLSYQVHVERGQTYWGEYYFDGKLFAKQ